MKIAVFGAGAIGGALAAYLHAAQVPVTLLARGATYAALAEHGLHVVRPDGSVLVARPRLAREVDALGPQDVLFIALKAYQLPAALAGLAPLVGPATIIVPVINGILWWFGFGAGAAELERPIECVDPAGILSATLPPAQVIACSTYTGVERLAPDRLWHKAGTEVVFGLPAGGRDERLERVIELFRGSGLVGVAVERFRDSLWTKLLANATLNLISVLAGATHGEMLADALTRDTVRAGMREVEAIAQRYGSRLSMSIDERIASAAALGSFKASTLQDYEAGRPLELASIIAAPLELARRGGVAVPTLDTLYALLRLKAERAGLLPAIG